MGIRPRELRIGNWVKMKISDPIENYQISAILEKGVNSGSVGMLYEIIEPIPLTEKWLQRFGAKFELVENYYRYFILDYNVWQHYHISKAMPNMKDNLLWSFIVKNNDGKSYELYSITYVHQLQNLYFALTGEELELKTVEDGVDKKVDELNSDQTIHIEKTSTGYSAYYKSDNGLVSSTGDTLTELLLNLSDATAMSED